MLDNCEHVIATAAEVAEDLLRRCPALRLLATSREGLRVGGETIWPVPPLAADDAVRLFVARAQAAGAPLELSDDDRTVIADICARLDGLPLAIELAAARTRAFPITQIASRLNDRFRLLTGGSRTALPRQQTLRAVVDWSYELLFDDEQRVFERLSVFPGGCDLATAEAVCADDDDRGRRPRRPPPRPRRQVARRRRAERRRAALHPAADARRSTAGSSSPNAATPCASATRWRRHYAALCAQSAAAYTGDGQRAWLTAIDQEHDNLRAALEWAVANDDAETALTIAGGASWPHWLAGMVVEGKRWLDDAFACAGEADERTRALALTGRGLLDFLAGAPEHSDDDLDAALEIFRRHDDVASMALAYSFYAEQAAARGDLDEARRRRLDRARLLRRVARRPVRDRGARVLARRSWRSSTATSTRPSVHYRAAADGLRADRPPGHDLDVPRHGRRLRRARRRLRAPRSRRWRRPIATNDACGSRGFTGSLLARLGWALLHDGRRRRGPRSIYERALDGGPPAAQHAGGVPRPHRHGRAAPAPRPRRRRGRGGHRGAGALPGRRIPPVPEPRRPRHATCRSPPRCAAWCSAAIAAERRRPGTGGDPARAGRAPARRCRRRGPGVPARRRGAGSRAAIAALGADAFAAAFERAASGAERDCRRLIAGVQRQRGRSSARSWMVLGRPARRGPDSRRIP